MHHENTKREDVDFGGVLGPGKHCLGWHEGGGALRLRLCQLCRTARAHVQDLGHAKVRDLGSHTGCQ